jgi:hypothetical protein
VWRGVVASELLGRLQQVMPGKGGERAVPRVGGWQRHL